MEDLLHTIRQCTLCSAVLPCAPKPVLSAGPKARILLIGQAPGRKVQESGIAWDDASGKNLRRWLGVTVEEFYDPSLFALVPMGFCYPGTGKSGDLPPSPICAPAWHGLLHAQMPDIQLTLLIGQYAQRFYLGKRAKSTLTETVLHFEEFLPDYLPLVHPSPRNGIWQRKNPWFEQELVPVLQQIVRQCLRS
jgi:uracil-DNA glycosylase